MKPIILSLFLFTMGILVAQPKQKQFFGRLGTYQSSFVMTLFFEENGEITGSYYYLKHVNRLH